jgi:AcrR family transcriptional regulator
MKILDSASKASPEETRSRILAAAREIFALKGTRGTTTREVADRADVNEATLFRHFGNKQTLLRDMLEEYCGAAGGLRALLEELHGPVEEQLATLGHFAIERLKSREDLIRVSLAEQSSDPAACTMTWRGPKDAHTALEDFMRRRVDAGELKGEPAVLARAFMSFWFAYVLGRAIWDEGLGDTAQARERAVRKCVDIFLNGVRA